MTPPLSSLSTPHWVSPDPGRWTVEKFPPLPPSQPTETLASRPLPVSPSMPEHMRRNRDTAEPSPRPMSATEPPLTGSFSRHCPSSSLRTSCFPVPIKKTLSMPRSSTPSPLPIPVYPSSSPSRKCPKSASPSRRVRENSGRRWSRRWCKVEESSRRRRSASSPSSSASPTSSLLSISFPCQHR
jgi:hypothetical protein